MPTSQPIFFLSPYSCFIRGGLLFIYLFFSVITASAQSESTERAPFVTTPLEVVQRMLLLAKTGPGDVVFDLGSGDGRIPIAAATMGARGVGLELDPALVQLSQRLALEAGVAQRTEFRVQDVLQADLSSASVVTVFLLPSLMSRLMPKLMTELRPGARVVTHAFYFPSWKPDQMEQVAVQARHYGVGDSAQIMLWIVPMNLRGRYLAQDGFGQWQFTVHQNFQEIEIEGSLNGQPVQFESARLQGTQVRWQAEVMRDGQRVTVQFEAEALAQGGLQGRVLSEKSAQPFFAKRQP